MIAMSTQTPSQARSTRDSFAGEDQAGPGQRDTVSRRAAVRVCHLTSVHAHTDVRILIKECSSLAANGFETHLVAPGTEDVLVNGVQVHGVQKARGRLARAILTTWRVYRKAREIDADIYHFHDSELIPAGLWLKRLGKRVIYDSHEDLPRQIMYKGYIPAPARKTVAAVVERLENLAARRFDYVVTPTLTIRDRFLREHCRALDVSNFPILAEFDSGGRDWADKEAAVCYVGGLTVERGTTEMVQALRGLDVKLLLAGAIEGEELRRDLQNLPEWDQVEYAGLVLRQGVADIFNRSVAGLVVLHPTQNYLDSYPIKMFEYMAAGIPVIASDFPKWRTLIGHGGCAIFVDPRNPTAIGEAISWVMENPVEAEEMGKRGRVAAETTFNWTTEELKLLGCYDEIARKLDAGAPR